MDNLLRITFVNKLGEPEFQQALVNVTLPWTEQKMLVLKKTYSTDVLIQFFVVFIQIAWSVQEQWMPVYAVWIIHKMYLVVIQFSLFQS